MNASPTGISFAAARKRGERLAREMAAASNDPAVLDHLLCELIVEANHPQDVGFVAISALRTMATDVVDPLFQMSDVMGLAQRELDAHIADAISEKAKVPLVSLRTKWTRRIFARLHPTPGRLQ